MIGVRDSNDKTRAAALIVCSHGMFTGDEFCLYRKHTPPFERSR